VSDLESGSSELIDKRFEELCARIRLIEQLVREESRLTALDQLLLFISSSTTLLFSAFQVFLAGKEALLYFAPLFLSGLIMPIYVGYYRGAVLLGSKLERARGWMYMTVGLLTYLICPGFFLLPYAVDHLLPPSTSPVVGLICFLCILFSLYYLALAVARERSPRFLLSLFRIPLSPETLLVLEFTGFNSFLLSLGFAPLFFLSDLKEEIPLQLPLPPASPLPFIFISLPRPLILSAYPLFFLGAILIEREARKLVFYAEKQA